MPIIQPDELRNLYKQEADFIIIHAGNGEKARANYKYQHLDKAFYMDLETQLAAPKINPANGGRHPLPATEDFSKLLTQYGVQKNSHVILYDEHNGANAAARLWWMLKAAGIVSVQVVNGGFQQAVKHGVPVNNIIVNPAEAKQFIFNEWALPIADMQEVEIAVNSNEHLIIDVRDSERFLGLKEPLDLVAGHIPNAINIPFKSNLDLDGNFLPDKELKKKYEEAIKNIKPENCIVHCGSGVTACHTLLAMASAGMPLPKLYTGSWSEWSRNNNPIITKM